MTSTPSIPLLTRLHSLDVFRGLTIAAMLLVNKQGNSREGYEVLQHVPWHGATPTDWIFPFFLFIVGVALPFSIARRKRRGESDASILRHALIRAAILFALGMFEKNFPFTTVDLETVRIPGVLQRIAFCYVAAVFLLLKTTARTQGIVTAVLLVGYWILLTFVPVPGLGVVPLTLEEAPRNWAAWLDQLTMGRHLGYGNYTWDANGLLSSFPSIASTLFGVFTANLLTGRDGSPSRPVNVDPSPGTPAAPATMSVRRDAAWRVVRAGFVVALAGWLWGGLAPLHGLGILGEPTFTAPVFFPINKMMWTSSYVLWTSGLAMVILGGCIQLIDVRTRPENDAPAPAWAMPFTWLGMNAIFVYIASTIVWKCLGMIPVGDTGSLLGWAYRQVFAAALPSPALASLVMSLAYLAVWIAVAAVMYQRRVFVKL